MIKRLNGYFKPHSGLFLAGILFVFLSNLFSIYPARLISRSLDLILESLKINYYIEDISFASEFKKDVFTTIIVFVVSIMLMAIMKGFFMFMMRQTLIIMSRRIEYRLKNEIYSHYQSMDQSFFKIHPIGDLMTRISEDVSKVRNYVGPALMYTINMIIMFILVISMMLSVSPSLTAAALSPMPVLAIGIYLVNKEILERSDKAQKLLSHLTSFVQETVAGSRILKSYSKEAFFSAEFAKYSLAYRNAGLSLAKVDAILFPIVLFLIGSSTLLTLWAGGSLVTSGKITPGVIAEFIVYVNMLTWPVASIGWVTSIIQQALVSFKRICEFLDTESKIISGTLQTPKEIEILEFDNVSFTFPDTGIQALSNVSFTVRKGDVLCITGQTGSGKSALLSLILRFYDPNEGVIKLNGIDIRMFDLASYRRIIGFVPQDSLLFSESVAQNIGWGISEVPSPQILKKSAQDSFVLDSVLTLPQQFDTQVGEKGVKLSGGQKQRIALARALIRKPSILVLDDCLSSVDYETEKNIKNSIDLLKNDLILIMTGHRVSTFPKAAFILTLEHGRIIEFGRADELLKKDGYFAAITREQSGEIKLNAFLTN